MLIRLMEFSAFLIASVGAAFFYLSPQINPRWRPALKYAMWVLVVVMALSEFLLKDLTGKGWEDRAAHLAGYAFCAVIPQFPRCYERTVADLSEAIQEDPRNPGILAARGNTYLGHGDFDRAIDDFGEAIRLNPKFAVAYAGRAHAYRAKGDNDRAISDIRQANTLDSQFASAAFDMAYAGLARTPPYIWGWPPDAPTSGTNEPPIATDAVLEGDDKQTRFMMDLSRTVHPWRVFTLVDPYRIVIEIPQVDFRFRSAFAGEDGRGVVKGFRYGAVTAGSRIVIDLTVPAKVTKAVVLGPGDGHTARFVLEMVATDRDTFLRTAWRPRDGALSIVVPPTPPPDDYIFTEKKTGRAESTP